MGRDTTIHIMIGIPVDKLISKIEIEESQIIGFNKFTGLPDPSVKIKGTVHKAHLLNGDVKTIFQFPHPTEREHPLQYNFLQISPLYQEKNFVDSAINEMRLGLLCQRYNNNLSGFDAASYFIGIKLITVWDACTESKKYFANNNGIPNENHAKEDLKKYFGYDGDIYTIVVTERY